MSNSTISRRNWLRQTSLAAAALGFSMTSKAGEDYLRRSSGSDTGIINLGSNENPYGISPKAKQAIMDMMDQTNRYQFNVPSLQNFRKEIAAHYGMQPDQLLVTAGSGEGLNLVARHYSKGNIVAPNITFGILPATARRIGTTVIEVPLTADRVHDLPALLAAINNETSLVYICNPANPTSTLLKPAALKSFCSEASKKTTVLIDEAYIDFLEGADSESMASLTQNNPNILVIRTFSKIHAMAGLRVGFIIGHSNTIRQLEKNYFSSTNYCISNLSMAAALASLQDPAHQNASRQKNAAARKFTIEELRKLNYSPADSHTNFIFFPIPAYKGNFDEDMFRKNIILRSNNNPSDKWARVSIGTMEEMKRFIDVMKVMSV